MSVPRFQKKLDYGQFALRASFSPALSKIQSAILCYQPTLFRFAINRWRDKQLKGVFGSCYQLRGTQIGVWGEFGVGAPVTAVLLEQLAVSGVKQVVSIGLAGGLTAQLTSGTSILVDGAIRDEGTSHHYLPASQPARPHPDLTHLLAQQLQNRHIPYQTGQTWTTDAPYRETYREIAHYAGQNILTVEMETATLFAVGHHLGLQVATILVVADGMGEDCQWHTDYDTQAVQNSLQKGYEAILATLQA